MAIINPHTNEHEASKTSGSSAIFGARPNELGYRLMVLSNAAVKDGVRGVILPSYDYTMDVLDGAFPMSVSHCWKNEKDEKNQLHFRSTCWATTLRMYLYVGGVEGNKRHFISPGSAKDLFDPVTGAKGADLPDAFYDVYRYVAYSKKFDENTITALTKRPKTGDAIIPSRTNRYVSLALTWSPKEPSPKLTVLIYTGQAFDHILTQLRWRPVGCAPRDPMWPDYLLGDHTNPNAALVWAAKQERLSAKDTQDSNVILFTDRPEMLNPNQETLALSRDHLASRFVINALESWEIPSYQTMVDFMVHSCPLIPLDIIKAACGHSANVGAREAAATHFNAPGYATQPAFGYAAPPALQAPAFPAAAPAFPSPPAFQAPAFPAAAPAFPSQPTFQAPAAPAFPPAQPAFQAPAAPATLQSPPAFPPFATTPAFHPAQPAVQAPAEQPAFHPAQPAFQAPAEQPPFATTPALTPSQPAFQAPAQFPPAQPAFQAPAEQPAAAPAFPAAAPAFPSQPAFQAPAEQPPFQPPLAEQPAPVEVKVWVVTGAGQQPVQVDESMLATLPQGSMRLSADGQSWLPISAAPVVRDIHTAGQNSLPALTSEAEIDKFITDVFSNLADQLTPEEMATARGLAARMLQTPEGSPKDPDVNKALADIVMAANNRNRQ